MNVCIGLQLHRGTDVTDLIPVCYTAGGALQATAGSFENGEGVLAGVWVLQQGLSVFGCPTDTSPSCLFKLHVYLHYCQWCQWFIVVYFSFFFAVQSFNHQRPELLFDMLYFK